MSNLLEIGKKYRTDKAAGGVDLASYYDGFFKDRRDEVHKVLEIGIGHTIAGLNGFMVVNGYTAGASLFMWEEYFPNAEIYALDIVPEILINRGRIHSFLCDQGSEESLKQIMPLLGAGFDLIVDDGSHDPKHQILAANTFAPLLGRGGIYFIEDITGDASRAKLDKEVLAPHEFKEHIVDGKIGDLMMIIMEENTALSPC